MNTMKKDILRKYEEREIEANFYLIIGNCK